MRGVAAKRGRGEPVAGVDVQFAEFERPAPERPGVLARMPRALDGERPRFFLWSPVALGAGIAGYFALPFEPGLATCLAPAAIALILLAGLPRGSLVAALAAFLTLAGLGGLIAKVRVESVRAPVLEKRMNSVIVTGLIERVEPRDERGARLTILVESLGTLDAAHRPRRVRVRTLSVNAVPKTGERVELTATLSPPAEPSLPGAFDFARTAWFDGIGGVGFAFATPKILPPLAAAPTLEFAFRAGIESLRATINARLSAVLGGQTGAIAEALVTGERGRISKATNDVFRESGLFHILSISGLHMVIMAGAVFYAVRLALAAVPALALRFEIKKWAATAGIAAALGYLAISGGAFATVRSAVMIVIMFTAILLDRPALALRNVALAALLILLVYPESLFDAGFQMSFAAVVGLVAAYEVVRQRFERRGEPHPILRVLMFFGGIVFSTLIASAAVAPFAAYHFHQTQQYAVLANLIAIPICNFIVMPASLAALVLMPLGLEALPLKAMGAGIDAMQWCAAYVARLPGAVGHIPAIPDAAFLLMILGGLWMALVAARWRILGAAGIVAGVALAPFLERPDLIVARGGTLVAVRGADGLLSALPARQARYELERWLEFDGDARSAKDVEAASAFRCDGVGCTARVKGVELAVSRHAASIADDCARAGIIVLPVPRPKSTCEGAALVIDYFDIWRQGVHALYIGGGREAGRVRIETVAAHRGERPWAHPERLAPRKLPSRRLEEPGDAAAVADDAGGPATLPGLNDRQAPRFITRPDWLDPENLRPENLRPEIEDDERALDLGPETEAEAP